MYISITPITKDASMIKIPDKRTLYKTATRTFMMDANDNPIIGINFAFISDDGDAYYYWRGINETTWRNHTISETDLKDFVL
jgi:hypothetical protein